MDVGVADIKERLRREILLLQGFKSPAGNTSYDIGPATIKDSFPNHCFPLGAMHEFLYSGSESAAASNGFMAGLIGQLMKTHGVCVWISGAKTVFPPALKMFGIRPEQVIFLHIQKEKQALWAMEEVLKCDGIAVVAGEIEQLDFTASRRLQLATEQSGVTGFLLRKESVKQNTIACAARWRITPQPSVLPAGMPGVGFPRWKVELLKVRNGTTGVWEIEWIENTFREVAKKIITASVETEIRAAG